MTKTNNSVDIIKSDHDNNSIRSKDEEFTKNRIFLIFLKSESLEKT